MKHLIKSLILVPVLFFFAAESYGQAIGISYENRSEKPTNGIGLHFEKDLSPLPVLTLNLRLHGTYFSEDYTSQATEVSEKSYEIGFGLLGGANLGIVAPYAGVGIGLDFFDREFETAGTLLLKEGSEQAFFYYGVVGLGVSALPFVRPYIEYRYRGITTDDYMPSENGTFAIGVQLRF